VKASAFLIPITNHPFEGIPHSERTVLFHATIASDWHTIQPVVLAHSAQSALHGFGRSVSQMNFAKPPHGHLSSIWSVSMCSLLI